MEYIKCPKCKTLYRIPHTDKLLEITCRECNQIFYNKEISSPKKKNYKYLFIGVSLILIVALIWFINNSKSGDSIISHFKSDNWVTISYSDLVDKSILTHSGETVGEVIKKIPNYTDDIKGLVQPYLEPYSILCHNVLLATTKPDTLPLINIINHYPIGSEQPVWVALFREGHYQLYYNSHLIRVFIKGSNPETSYQRQYSVIRHPIRDVINSNDINIKNIEIYVFNNNYSTNEIKLNTIPFVINKNDLSISPYNKPDLPSKRKPINLVGIKDFLEQDVIFEAIEIDSQNDMYLYGRKADKKQTLSGNQLSLSDFAIIYRSIFHYGFNSPYISLDNHKDNRYAKVNFGGHLENTYAGNVVLEADKLFKTLSTGLDPNSHKLIRSNITKKVPDFLTEDERNLLENFGEKHMQIRYWFYPDSIVTVTDGSIGAVQKYQFFADIERMDAKFSVGNAVRKTIDHLNKNYSQYEKACYTFKELSTVGRFMALINWLKGMNMNDRIELDDLLSVMIPSFTTPVKTKKMLAVTAIAYPNRTILSNRDVRSYSKVFSISHLLDTYNSSTSDKRFLEVAGNFFSNIDISDLAPPIYNKTISEKNYYDNLIKSNESKINYFKTEIKIDETKLDRYNSVEVNQFNNLVDKYNNLLKKQESYINNFNSKINKLNNLNIVSNCITSIGGGIDLHPTEFKIISNNPNSPKLQQIRSIKNKIKTIGKISNYKNWIRSNSGNGGSIINEISLNSFDFSKLKNENTEYKYNSMSGDFTSVTTKPNSENWQSKVSVNGSTDYSKYSKETNQLQIVSSNFIGNCNAVISSNGKHFVFHH